MEVPEIDAMPVAKSLGAEEEVDGNVVPSLQDRTAVPWIWRGFQHLEKLASPDQSELFSYAAPRCQSACCVSSVRWHLLVRRLLVRLKSRVEQLAMEFLHSHAIESEIALQKRGRPDSSKEQCG